MHHADPDDQPTILLSHQQAQIVCELLTHLYDNAPKAFDADGLDLLELLHDTLDPDGTDQ